MSTEHKSTSRKPIVLRLHPDETLDEIVADRDIHLEQLDSGYWYLGVGGMQVWFHSKKRIHVTYAVNDEQVEIEHDGVRMNTVTTETTND